MSATLDAGRAAIQSGEAFKPPPAADDFDEFGEALGSKGGGLSGLSASIKSAWGSATRNLGTYLSVAESQTKVIELEAKSKGRAPTEEELEEACGPLSFLTKIPNILGDALSDIFGKFDEFASAIGETVSEFMGKLDSLIDDVANAIDEVAQEIAQAALDAFEAVNAVALQAIEAIESVVNTVTGAINDAIQFATDAFNSAVDKLLAFADGLNFASLFGLECQKEALEEAVDKEKIADTAEVNRVVGPTIVEGTESPISSTTLAEPQTEFAQVQTSVPPSLNQLIENFRSAARKAVLAGQEVAIAFVQKRPSTVSIAERDALNLAAEQERNKLLLEAANQGVPANDLPIYGPEFNLTARGIEAAQQPVAVSSKSQQTIDELAPVKSRYDAANQDQLQLAIKLKFDILPSTPDNIRLFNEKNAEAKSLRQQLVSKIDSLSPKDQQAVAKEIGIINDVLKP
jgi:cob(I)alamin adenosyltransferase